MSFTIKMIDHVVLYVSDMERSISFYESVLGCKLVKRNAAINLVHLSAGASMIDLLPAPQSDTPGRNVDHVALQIEPFDGDALLAHLKDHGLDPSPVRDRFGAEGTGPSLTFEDPDGNTIELKGPSKS